MRVNGKGVFFCLQRVAREMIRAQRRHHQHRVDRGQGLRGHVERHLRRAARARARHDPDRRPAARPPQHQRERHLSRHHGHRAVRANLRDRAREEGVSVEEMSGDGTPTSRSVAQRAGRHRRLAVFLGVTGRPQHHGQSFNVDGGLIFD
jgi:transposase